MVAALSCIHHSHPEQVKMVGMPMALMLLVGKLLARPSGVSSEHTHARFDWCIKTYLSVYYEW
jgi:hypothetical protein